MTSVLRVSPSGLDRRVKTTGRAGSVAQYLMICSGICIKKSLNRNECPFPGVLTDVGPAVRLSARSLRYLERALPAGEQGAALLDHEEAAAGPVPAVRGL